MAGGTALEPAAAAAVSLHGWGLLNQRRGSRFFSSTGWLWAVILKDPSGICFFSLPEESVHHVISWNKSLSTLTGLNPVVFKWIQAIHHVALCCSFCTLLFSVVQKIFLLVAGESYASINLSLKQIRNKFVSYFLLRLRENVDFREL